MTITVTREDIQNGRRCDPDCCPIGRALARAGIRHLGVVGSTIILRRDCEHASHLPLPDGVHQWIQDFDLSRPVTPISFELRVEQPEEAAVLSSEA